MFCLFAIKVLLDLICFGITYLKRSDNLSRLAFLESLAKLVHKSRAGQSNVSYDILLPISFRMLLIHIKLNRLCTISVCQ